MVSYFEKDVEEIFKRAERRKVLGLVPRWSTLSAWSMWWVLMMPWGIMTGLVRWSIELASGLSRKKKQ
jgi:hypothetical protein